jgi:adenosylhomocysteine nucleosidase
MLVEPFAPRGDVPFSTQPNAYFSNSGTYTCGTGDSFVQNNDPWLAQQGVDIVDMELFAIAKVACAFNISWSAYKFISDEANANSVNDWQSQINLGQTQFLEKLKSII